MPQQLHLPLKGWQMAGDAGWSEVFGAAVETQTSPPEQTAALPASATQPAHHQQQHQPGDLVHTTCLQLAWLRHPIHVQRNVTCRC